MPDSSISGHTTSEILQTHCAPIAWSRRVYQADQVGHVAAPAKPSIVVLPFDNMSDDHAQEYFSDGISEDLTTALSRFAWLFVIARNSAFTYKGKAVDVKQVGRELGVRYVLEGSVRRAGDRVRVTAQLIDAESAATSGRSDTIATWSMSLNCRTILLRASQRRLALKSPSPRSNAHAANVETISTRGIAICGQWRLPSDDQAGHGCCDRRFGKAISIEPEFAAALALLGLCHLNVGMRGWIRPVRPAFDEARAGQNEQFSLAGKP